MTELLKCSICGDEIQPHPITGWSHGNNAEPINEGRCCDYCDATVVIPTRIKLMMAGKPTYGVRSKART